MSDINYESVYLLYDINMNKDAYVRCISSFGWVNAQHFTSCTMHDNSQKLLLNNTFNKRLIIDIVRNLERIGIHVI